MSLRSPKTTFCSLILPSPPLFFFLIPPTRRSSVLWRIMLSDWESDLTDLSSDEDDVPLTKVKDEDEYVPSQSKRKKATTTKTPGSDYKVWLPTLSALQS